MPVIPDCPTLFRDRADLRQFLLACKQTPSTQTEPQIASISLDIPPVDPLVVLEAMAPTDRHRFYLERRCEGQAIAAFQPVLQLRVDGADRFARIQAFIDRSLKRAIAVGAEDAAWSGPRFFCSFTFFDRPTNSEAAFPAATVFLPRWQVIRDRDRCLAVATVVLDGRESLDLTCQTLWHELQTLRSLRDRRLPRIAEETAATPQWQVSDAEPFKAAVAEALGLIEQSQLSKIVLAHTIEATASQPFRTIASLANLRRIHNDCYTFLVSNGGGQTFMGASPERLIGIRDRELLTDALAGSAPRGATPLTDRQLTRKLFNSTKERHEHQVVIDFITQHLARLDLTPRFSNQPSIRQLSNIQHLWTPIRANLPAGTQPLDVLAALHPTPAVAGVPRDRACEHIRRWEPFERSLYAAPLGWIDARGNSEFIVGIRSALIEGTRACLYAGAGIVAGSNPDRELAEIQLKLQALLSALV